MSDHIRLLLLAGPPPATHWRESLCMLAMRQVLQTRTEFKISHAARAQNVKQSFDADNIFILYLYGRAKHFKCDSTRNYANFRCIMKSQVSFHLKARISSDENLVNP